MRNAGLFNLGAARIKRFVVALSIWSCAPPTAGLFEPMLSSGTAQRACAAGFLGSDGLRCEPIVPTQRCAAGTMPQLGSTTCVPVGWTACPAGFNADPSGWGCAPQLPSLPCQGATQQRLGERACHPLGSCSAPFPPPAATLFVDPGAQVDATHFRTIAAALAVAAPGATIAIDTGTYVEALSVRRAVTMIGRCAGSVQLVSPGANVPGLDVSSGVALVLRGLTVRGHRFGLRVNPGGTAEVSECALLENRDVHVMADGAQVTLRDSALRDGVPQSGPTWGRGVMAQSGATLTLERVSLEHNQAVSVLALAPAIVHVRDCVIRDTAPSMAGDGLGLAIEGDAQVVVSGSAFIGNQGRAISVRTGALTLTQSSLQDTLPRPNGQTGFGLSVSLGGRVDITSSAITRNQSLGLSVANAGSRLTLTDSVVTQTKASTFGEMGIEASEGTSVTLTRTAVVDNASVGLSVFGGEASLRSSFVGGTRANINNTATGLNLQNGARLDAVDCAIVANDSAGVLIIEPNPGLARQHTLARSLVMDTIPQADGGPGRGVSVQGGRIVLEGSAIVGNTEVAVFLRHPGAEVVANDSVLMNTAIDLTGVFGFGVVARDGARWRSTNTDIRGNGAVGLAFSNASGSLERGLVSDQPIALAVQDGSTLVAVEAVSPVPDAGVFEVSSATVFSNNGTKVGAGNLPLPP